MHSDHLIYHRLELRKGLARCTAYLHIALDKAGSVVVAQLFFNGENQKVRCIRNLGLAKGRLSQTSTQLRVLDDDRLVRLQPVAGRSVVNGTLEDRPVLVRYLSVRVRLGGVTPLECFLDLVSVYAHVLLRLTICNNIGYRCSQKI